MTDDGKLFYEQVLGEIGGEDGLTTVFFYIQNEDGTALTDLSGYKLYWGTTPGSYSNSVTIDDAGTTIYVVDNLSPGTYEFVATSFNAAGVESGYSSPATKVLQ